MGFLLPEIHPYSNQTLREPLIHMWRQSGDSAFVMATLDVKNPPAAGQNQ
jgi:hypothetical protein